MVVSFGEPMKGLAGQELLSHLALELDAVRTMLGHGLPSFESPAQGSIPACPTVRPRGPTPGTDEFYFGLDCFIPLATETFMRSAAAVHHAILPRKLSASAESALASCLAVSGDGSGILRFCALVAGSRTIHGCAGALGSLAAARAAIICVPTRTKACQELASFIAKGFSSSFSLRDRSLSRANIHIHT